MCASAGVNMNCVHVCVLGGVCVRACVRACVCVCVYSCVRVSNHAPARQIHHHYHHHHIIITTITVHGFRTDVKFGIHLPAILALFTLQFRTLVCRDFPCYIPVRTADVSLTWVSFNTKED